MLLYKTLTKDYATGSRHLVMSPRYNPECQRLWAVLRPFLLEFLRPLISGASLSYHDDNTVVGRVDACQSLHKFMVNSGAVRLADLGHISWVVHNVVGVLYM